MSAEERRLRAALEESDELIDAVLHDLLLMRLTLECTQEEIRAALAPSEGESPVAVLHVVRAGRPS